MAARAVQQALGNAYYVNDLIRMNKTFVSALRFEKLGMSIAIGLIVLVAALNIISILILMVMEKVRDIGVLLAMGATSQGIRRIFLMQGLIIAALGTGAGIVLGILLAWIDRKSTRLNSSHGYISYAVFCLKKKKKKHTHRHLD